MKVAFSTLACPGWTLDQIIDAALHYGYEGLELRVLDGKLLQPDLPTETRQRVLSACQKARLPIVSVDTSVQTARPDTVERREQVHNGLAMLELAAQWEAPFIRVYGQPPDGITESDLYDCAADALAQLAERGEQLGIAVLVETHDALASGRRAAEVLNRVPNPFAGALWDMLHPYRMDEQPDETLRVLGNRVRHVHVKDGRRAGNEWQLVPLGEGEVPVVRILSALRQAGYDGWLSVEWEKYWHPELAEPEIALPQHIAQLREYLDSPAFNR